MALASESAATMAAAMPTVRGRARLVTLWLLVKCARRRILQSCLAIRAHRRQTRQGRHRKGISAGRQLLFGPQLKPAEEVAAGFTLPRQANARGKDLPKRLVDARSYAADPAFEIVQ